MPTPHTLGAIMAMVEIMEAGELNHWLEKQGYGAETVVNIKADVAIQLKDPKHFSYGKIYEGGGS